MPMVGAVDVLGADGMNEPMGVVGTGGGPNPPVGAPGEPNAPGTPGTPPGVVCPAMGTPAPGTPAVPWGGMPGTPGMPAPGTAPGATAVPGIPGIVPCGGTPTGCVEAPNCGEAATSGVPMGVVGTGGGASLALAALGPALAAAFAWLAFASPSLFSRMTPATAPATSKRPATAKVGPIDERGRVT